MNSHEGSPVGNYVYKGDPDVTAEGFVGGCLRAEDIDYIDNGKIYLVDRVKDIIKVNGWTCVSSGA